MEWDDDWDMVDPEEAVNLPYIDFSMVAGQEAVCVRILRLVQDELIRVGSYICPKLEVIACTHTPLGYEQMAQLLILAIEQALAPNATLGGWIRRKYPLGYYNEKYLDEARLRWVDEMIAELEAQARRRANKQTE